MLAAGCVVCRLQATIGLSQATLVAVIERATHRCGRRTVLTEYTAQCGGVSVFAVSLSEGSERVVLLKHGMLNVEGNCFLQTKTVTVMVPVEVGRWLLR